MATESLKTTQLLQRYAREFQAAIAAGHRREAIQPLEEALKLQPTADGFRNLAILRLEVHEPIEALAACESALTLQPGDATTHGLRGDILFQLDRWGESIRAYEQAVAIDPDLCQAWMNLAIACSRLGDDKNALRAWHNVHRLLPADLQSAIEFGRLLLKNRLYEDAHRIVDEALRHHPASGALHQLHGVILHKLRRSTEALAALDQAHALEPSNMQTIFDRGVVLDNLGCSAEALAAYTTVERVVPHHIEARWNAALLLLRQQRWLEAWPRFEARLERPIHKKYSNEIQSIPRWDGRNARGKQKILLLAEQGLGDTLMFIRYASLVRRRGFEVSLLAQAPLRTLLTRTAGIDHVVDESVNPSSFDVRIELLSLAGLFATTPTAIPFANTPYLQVCPQRLDQWRSRLGPKKRPRIALMWRGSPNPWLAERSIPLKLLAGRLPDQFEYFSLQRELTPEEIGPAGKLRLETYGGASVDFEDAAALITLADITISIDTSMAHLAGALGCPLWLMVPSRPEWRWATERSTTPWYPNVEILRAREDGDWSAPVAELARRLV